MAMLTRVTANQFVHGIMMAIQWITISFSLANDSMQLCMLDREGREGEGGRVGGAGGGEKERAGKKMLMGVHGR